MCFHIYNYNPSRRAYQEKEGKYELMLETHENAREATERYES